ncbi:MAG: RsmB/NOP family class I SAM-dependent RNA methyltransferase [Betaproteobacteria bacterium]|nr:RsmB/NOP family class I SAM-dependent RNA methyltransferase [Betaproteobacteria bacterium]
MKNASPKSSQLGAVVAAVERVWPGAAPADAVLKSYFRERGDLGARDRALVAETVYAMLRRRQLLEHLAPGATPRQYTILGLSHLVGWSGAQMDAVLARGERDWLDGVKARRPTALPLAVEADLPDWVEERLSPQLGEDGVRALGRALQCAAPLDLRVNTMKMRREEALAAFRESGIDAAPTPFSPLGLRLPEKIALTKHPLFMSGAVEVQDEGSQLLGLVVEARRGEMVADFCAGAGGKSLLIGAQMQSSGRVYAFDTSEKRLANLAPRLKRSGLSNLFPVRIDSENDGKVKRLAGKLHRVLVDAPCSGLGTLRRNPDLKTRQSPQGVTELVAKQTAILASAARLVKPGGRLVYATCSLLSDENEAIAESFLTRHADFRLLDSRDILRRLEIDLTQDSPWLRLWPHLHHTDGFFAAVMARNA